MILPFKAWFHATLSRQQSESLLSRVTTEGAFLVRVGERVSGSFAISFRAERPRAAGAGGDGSNSSGIKHCLVKQEGRLFAIGSAQFESLVDLIAYFEKHPLYKKVRR